MTIRDVHISAEEFPRGGDAPLGRREVLLFFGAAGIVLLAAFLLRIEEMAFFAVLGLLAVFVVMQNAMTWILVSIGSFFMVFWSIEEGLTPPEIAHTVLYFGGLLWWFFHRLVIAKQPLRWTPGSVLTVLLVLQMLLLAPVSMSINADPYVWLREMFILSSVLMLFPIAHECSTRRRQYLVGAAFVLSLFLLSMKNIYMYKQKVVEAVWVWQVGASRASETFFLIFVLAVVGMALLISARRPLSVLLNSMFLLAGAAATVLSFYRTIWVAALLSYGMMGMLLGRRFWRRAMLYFVVVLIAFSSLYPIFLADVVPLDVMWLSISNRFGSIKTYRKDVSLKNREVESAIMIDRIGGHWLLGTGIGTTVRFMKIMTMTTIEPTWTHNGYAWALHHFGVLGTLLLFASWLYYAWLGWRALRMFRRARGDDDEEGLRLRLYLAAGMAIILSTFLISWTINQFLSQEAGIVFGVVFGLFEAWHRDACNELAMKEAAPGNDAGAIAATIES